MSVAAIVQYWYCWLAHVCRHYGRTTTTVPTVLRGATVNRTYGTHKKTYFYPFLLKYLVLFTMVPLNSIVEMPFVVVQDIVRDVYLFLLGIFGPPL